MTVIETFSADAIAKLTRDHERLKYTIAKLQSELRSLRHGRDIPIRWVNLTETLLPGESATAKFQLWDGSAWTDSGLDAIDVYDSEHMNFGLTGAKFQVFQNLNGRLEIVGSHGIHNVKAKVKTGVTITSGGSGLVEIWEDGSASGEEVTAHLDWIHTESIAAATEIFIDWKREQDKWIVSDNACA